MAFIKKKINLPDIQQLQDPEKFHKELLELLTKYSLELSDVVNGGLKINENVNGFPGSAVADATGAGDVVDQLNALLAELRSLNIIES